MTRFFHTISPLTAAVPTEKPQQCVFLFSRQCEEGESAACVPRGSLGGDASFVVLPPAIGVGPVLQCCVHLLVVLCPRSARRFLGKPSRSFVLWRLVLLHFGCALAMVLLSSPASICSSWPSTRSRSYIVDQLRSGGAGTQERSALFGIGVFQKCLGVQFYLLLFSSLHSCELRA